MSIKSLAGKATAKIGRQVLIAQKHSPTILIATGVVGTVTSVVLACRATLKVSDVLEDAEKQNAQINERFEADGGNNKVLDKKKLNVKVQTAINVAKLYAPATIVLVGSLAAITGSHIILKRRNAGLVAAYATLDKMFKDYRGRVVEDQGAEKDREYYYGVTEKEIVEEGPNGPEVKYVKGVDVKAMKANAGSMYSRVFDEDNANWDNIPGANAHFVQSQQNYLNDLLVTRGFVFLNEAYDLLGFEYTAAGQQVGWVRNPEQGKGDGYIDFGVWAEGVAAGKNWIINGHKDAMILDFNVDGVVTDLLQKV